MSKTAHSRQSDEASNEPTFSGITKVLWEADDIDEARELAANREGEHDAT